MTDRTRTFKLPGNGVSPETAFYQIVPGDVGLSVIRTSAGEIDITSDYTEGLGTSGSPGAEAVEFRHVGLRLYGHRNLGYSGPRWYWTTSPEQP